MRKISYLFIIISMVFPLTIKNISAEEDAKISGTVYFFYYHDLSKENGKTNAFDFGRVYLTYKKSLSQKFKVRITTDIGRINSITDLNWETYQVLDTHVVGDDSLFISDSDTREKKRKIDDRLQLFLKYAYLEWQKLIPDCSIILGLQGTPTWKIHEKYWGYRGIQKTLLDLNKLGSSADFGLGFKGKLVNKRLAYHFLLSNGAGYKHAEKDMYKKGHLRFTFHPVEKLAVSGYVDYELKDSENSDLTSDFFLGYRNDRFIIAGQYFNRFYNREENYCTNGFSIYGNLKIIPEVTLLGRFDWFDPDDKIEKDEHSLIICGIDYNPMSKIHFVLNGQFKSFAKPFENSINIIFLHTIYEF